MISFPVKWSKSVDLNRLDSCNLSNDEMCLINFCKAQLKVCFKKNDRMIKWTERKASLWQVSACCAVVTHLCLPPCVAVHVPVVQEPGLHPFVWDLPSGHQAPESAAGPRDGCAEALRLWQVRHTEHFVALCVNIDQIIFSLPFCIFHAIFFLFAKSEQNSWSIIHQKI